MSKWKKETFKLKKKHKWTAKPGHRIFVAGRGALRFEFPQKWIMKLDGDSIKFYDVEPPDDNCRLEASFNQLPVADWDSFPLETLLPTVIADDRREIVSMGQVITVKRSDLRLVWLEFCFNDPGEHRLGLFANNDRSWRQRAMPGYNGFLARTCRNGHEGMGRGH